MTRCRMLGPVSSCLCAALVCMLASCSSHPCVSPDVGRAPHLLGFPDTSHGNLRERLSEDPLAGETIEHIVIANGSGMHGYNSVSVSSSGAIEVVLETPSRKGRWRTFRVHNPTVASSILRSVALQKCRKLASRYQNDLNDGGQAFLWMKARSHHHEVSCSNVFPTEFSRLWEEVRRTIRETKANEWQESRGEPFAASRALNQERTKLKQPH